MSPTGSHSYLTCPMCDCEIPVSEDDKPGDDIYCPYCHVPLKLRKTKEDELFLVEDF